MANGQRRTVLSPEGQHVIPTGAKRTGGISSFGRFLAALGMTALLCWPATAQNGVTVTGLDVKPGTVTFNVSWKNTGMPALWRDTVWVFADYNKAGVTTRVPLSPGATLTATSAPDVGKVMEAPGNDQGVWIVGNARSAGSFSATVQLLTAAANLRGVCVYASNYPPVGKYLSAGTFSFTGTPEYHLLLKHIESGATSTASSGDEFTLPAGHVIASFSDATGAPGRIQCTPPAVHTLNISTSGFCTSAEMASFALSGTEHGVGYQLYRDGTPVGAVLTGTGSPATFTEEYNATGTYTARVVAGTYCPAMMTGTHTVTEYADLAAGAITTARIATPEGISLNATVQNAVLASGGSGNLTYLWLRSGAGGAATLTGNSAATYTISPDIYATPGTYYFNRYAKDATCNTAWVAAAGTYTLRVLPPGVNQPQGGCTFTQPPLIGTFANFDPGYSASTFVTLRDDRDSNNYTVVKINGRWIMAQNLNYQEGLTWQAEARKPSINVGHNPALIGHFWCPGGDGKTTSTRVACEAWGALYSWGTAMMVDGKWSSDAHTDSLWSEPTSYGNKQEAGNYQNHGRAGDGTPSGGRGICPPNWHVPTDGEWGNLFNSMETGADTTHHYRSGFGAEAGHKSKAKCICLTEAVCATDTKMFWNKNVEAGIDIYGFRVLPTGYRNDDYFYRRGNETIYWSSTAPNNTGAWFRSFADSHYIRRSILGRHPGFSVRCIRD
jgi:uncharacterized protein (TIGR02145 family)